jgi:hypothetical protein
MGTADDVGLRRLAREEAPEVLAEALRRAREKAVARLEELLSDAIVAEALAGLPGREPVTPPRRPDQRSSPGTGTPAGGNDEALYAYALTRADQFLPEGLPALTEGAQVGRVVEGGLALLVSPVIPDQLQVDQDDLDEDGPLATLVRGHDAVLRAAAAAGAVLPLRFGTVVASEEGARRLLRTHGPAAAAQLDRVDGKREWGVRLLRSLAPEPQLTGSAPRRENMSGTAYLTSRRAALEARERVEEHTRRAAAQLEQALAPFVAESLRRGGNPGSSLLLDAAYLVAQDHEVAFTTAVTELAEELRPDGLDVELTGPWPPYSFVSLDAGGDGDG